MNTNLFPRVLAVAALLLAMGCSTIASRRKEHLAAFDGWPLDVRQKVSAGRVDLGFTPEMVTVALGEPDRVVSRQTDRGVAEDWVYFERGPEFALGIGVGVSGGSRDYAGGLGVGGGAAGEEIARVTFEAGRVTAIERRK